MGELNSASGNDAPIPAKPNTPGIKPGDANVKDNTTGGARIPDPAAPARKEFLATDLETIRRIRNAVPPAANLTHTESGVQTISAPGTVSLVHTIIPIDANVGPPKDAATAGTTATETQTGANANTVLSSRNILTGGEVSTIEPTVSTIPLVAAGGEGLVVLPTGQPTGILSAKNLISGNDVAADKPPPPPIPHQAEIASAKDLLKGDGAAAVAPIVPVNPATGIFSAKDLLKGDDVAVASPIVPVTTASGIMSAKDLLTVNNAAPVPPAVEANLKTIRSLGTISSASALLNISPTGTATDIDKLRLGSPTVNISATSTIFSAKDLLTQGTGDEGTANGNHQLTAIPVQNSFSLAALDARLNGSTNSARPLLQTVSYTPIDLTAGHISSGPSLANLSQTSPILNAYEVSQNTATPNPAFNANLIPAAFTAQTLPFHPETMTPLAGTQNVFSAADLFKGTQSGQPAAINSETITALNSPNGQTISAIRTVNVGDGSGLATTSPSQTIFSAADLFKTDTTQTHSPILNAYEVSQNTATPNPPFNANLIPAAFTAQTLPFHPETMTPLAGTQNVFSAADLFKGTQSGQPAAINSETITALNSPNGQTISAIRTVNVGDGSGLATTSPSQTIFSAADLFKTNIVVPTLSANNEIGTVQASVLPIRNSFDLASTIDPALANTQTVHRAADLLKFNPTIQNVSFDPADVRTATFNPDATSSQFQIVGNRQTNTEIIPSTTALAYYTDITAPLKNEPQKPEVVTSGGFMTQLVYHVNDFSHETPAPATFVQNAVFVQKDQPPIVTLPAFNSSWNSFGSGSGMPITEGVTATLRGTGDVVGGQTGSKTINLAPVTDAYGVQVAANPSVFSLYNARNTELQSDVASSGGLITQDVRKVKDVPLQVTPMGPTLIPQNAVYVQNDQPILTLPTYNSSWNSVLTGSGSTVSEAAFTTQRGGSGDVVVAQTGSQTGPKTINLAPVTDAYGVQVAANASVFSLYNARNTELQSDVSSSGGLITQDVLKVKDAPLQVTPMGPTLIPQNAVYVQNDQPTIGTIPVVNNSWTSVLTGPGTVVNETGNYTVSSGTVGNGAGANGLRNAGVIQISDASSNHMSNTPLALDLYTADGKGDPQKPVPYVPTGAANEYVVKVNDFTTPGSTPNRTYPIQNTVLAQNDLNAGLPPSASYNSSWNAISQGSGINTANLRSSDVAAANSTGTTIFSAISNDNYGNRIGSNAVTLNLYTADNKGDPLKPDVVVASYQYVPRVNDFAPQIPPNPIPNAQYASLTPRESPNPTVITATVSSGGASLDQGVVRQPNYGITAATAFLEDKSNPIKSDNIVVARVSDAPSSNPSPIASITNQANLLQVASIRQNSYDAIAGAQIPATPAINPANATRIYTASADTTPNQSLRSDSGQLNVLPQTNQQLQISAYNSGFARSSNADVTIQSASALLVPGSKSITGGDIFTALPGTSNANISGSSLISNSGGFAKLNPDGSIARTSVAGVPDLNGIKSAGAADLAGIKGTSDIAGTKAATDLFGIKGGPETIGIKTQVADAIGAITSTIGPPKIDQQIITPLVSKVDATHTVSTPEQGIRQALQGALIDTTSGAAKINAETMIRINSATTIAGTLVQFDPNVRVVTTEVGPRGQIPEIHQPISFTDAQIKILINSLGTKTDITEIIGPRVGTVTLFTGTSVTFILSPDKISLTPAENTGVTASTKFIGNKLEDEVTATNTPITRKGIKQIDTEAEQAPLLPGANPLLNVNPTTGIIPGSANTATTASTQDPHNQDPNNQPISISSVMIAIKSLPSLEIFDPSNAADRATMTPTHKDNSVIPADIINSHQDSTPIDPGIPISMNHTNVTLPPELQGQVGRAEDHSDTIGRTDEGRGILGDKMPHADPLDQLGEVSGAKTRDDIADPTNHVAVINDNDDIGNRILTIATDYVGTVSEAGITDRSMEDLLSDLLNKSERKRYRIQSGDTLKKIAEKLLKDKRLAGLIYLLNPELLGTDSELDQLQLPPGSVLILPSAEEILQYKIHVLQDSLPDYLYEDLLQHPDERIARTAQEFRPAYACRYGDNLISVAARHPAMRDSSIWQLLAKLNNLSDRTNANGQPVTELKRGQKLVMPSRKDIRDYRRRNFRSETNATLATSKEFPAVHKSSKADGEDNTVISRPLEASHALNPFHGFSTPVQEHPSRSGVPSKARVITVPDLGDGLADLNLRLEIQYEGSWLPVMQYLVQNGQSQLHIYKLDGTAHTINIDLPSRSVRELAEADLAANYARYCLKFQKGERPI